MSTKPTKLRTLFWLTAVGLIGFVGCSAIQITRFSTQHITAAADVAIVLGAAVIDGEPSAVFKQRITHGIYLHETGQVHTLIFTGGIGEGDALAESEVGRNVALAAGVPAGDILIETQSRITQQNLREACRLMTEHQLETALIVSDPLHMKRSLTIAENIGLAAEPSPTTTSAYKTWRSKTPSLIYETFFFTLQKLKFSHSACVN